MDKTPTRSPARSPFMASQMLQLKSSYPASSRRPEREKATEVMPQMILSWEYKHSSWSARRSNSLQVASSEPVANALPLGKNWEMEEKTSEKTKGDISEIYISNVYFFQQCLLTQTALMSDSWPVNVCLHMLSLMSQSLMEASQAPEMKVRESGANDRLITSPLWPENSVVCWPVSMSHRALEQTHG